MKRLTRSYEEVYHSLNKSSFTFLQKHGHRVPIWFTADAVTSARLTLVLPTAILLSNGYHWIPAGLVLINATFDYVDGAVARWEQQDSSRAKALEFAKRGRHSQHLIVNFKTRNLEKTWGAYYGKLNIL